MDILLQANIRYHTNRSSLGPWLNRSLRARGAAMMKFGQFLRCRSDIIGSDVAECLQDLCVSMDTDDIPPPRIEGCFIDDKPFAVASIANMYRGIDLDTGDELVVKVKRPGVDADIDNMCRNTERWITLLAPFEGVQHVADTSSMMRDYIEWIRREIDFPTERTNLQRFASMRSAKVPVVLQMPNDKPSNTIVMSYVPTVSNPSHQLAMALMACFVEQIAVYGSYHADLHPGNVGQHVDGELVVFDFASIRPFPVPVCIPDMLACFVLGDTYALADTMVKSGVLKGSMTDAVKFCEHLVTYMSTGSDVNQFMRGIIDEKIDVHPSPSMAAFLRAFALVEGTCKTIDPDFDTSTAIMFATDTLARDGRFHRMELVRLLRRLIPV
jgi:ubiquinone biosynthesis protein